MKRNDLGLMASTARSKLPCNRKSAGQHAGAFVAAFGTQAGTAIGFARLFVELAATHFFLDTASLDQFSKPAYCLLNRFPITHQ
ncbi:hypothetical protein RE6C_02622 [Rhodopirellula europaea 6C]|uniref:Uncharacterized protein n=1 Tax=Rhodopirellula europaea 6C TaxID=1263867 RepID=M2A6U3_9BACT|nr:hypothetical protein RE6C_02622 [Rhodopirellula europaea 6C]